VKDTTLATPQSAAAVTIPIASGTFVIVIAVTKSQPVAAIARI
jgi:hypothetical protein